MVFTRQSIDGPDPRFALDTNISWDVVRINVGLAQARPNKDLIEAKLGQVTIHNHADSETM